MSDKENVKLIGGPHDNSYASVPCDARAIRITEGGKLDDDGEHQYVRWGENRATEHRPACLYNRTSDGYPVFIFVLQE
jgi:hypothetical protein